ncbi:DUF1801 domain-containing protein [Litoribrevibacter albus]|uniref:YdhG-like domain-containing protein n=1 Tax=Litoribrevibacter albus TaxID=1473156 RepID=A0AA37WAC9_9GAMM|nr:DUF1801 domain-containing protein [Litoribrevibacter albus]GLQ33581.1 hypothetical protein GCM10007876_40610 [Litoribrevibacter albus]
MSSDIQAIFDRYPAHVRPCLLRLRSLILDIAESVNLGKVEEALKWGEPSFQVKSGSPIRMDWKEKTPDQYYLFFHCQTKLVDTFRELYSNSLPFEGNRAIVLDVNKDLPEDIIRHCLTLAMQYKRIKHLPLLGA